MSTQQLFFFFFFFVHLYMKSFTIERWTIYMNILQGKGTDETPKKVLQNLYKRWSKVLLTKY